MPKYLRGIFVNGGDPIEGLIFNNGNNITSDSSGVFSYAVKPAYPSFDGFLAKSYNFSNNNDYLIDFGAMEKNDNRRVLSFNGKNNIIKKFGGDWGVDNNKVPILSDLTGLAVAHWVPDNVVCSQYMEKTNQCLLASNFYLFGPDAPTDSNEVFFTDFSDSYCASSPIIRDGDLYRPINWYESLCAFNRLRTVSSGSYGMVTKVLFANTKTYLGKVVATTMPPAQMLQLGYVDSAVPSSLYGNSGYYPVLCCVDIKVETPFYNNFSGTSTANERYGGHYLTTGNYHGFNGRFISEYIRGVNTTPTVLVRGYDVTISKNTASKITRIDLNLASEILQGEGWIYNGFEVVVTA